MSKLVDIRSSDDPRDLIHQAVHLLAEGELVAFPTETVYAVAAHSLRPSGIQKLRETLNGHPDQQCSLVVKGLQEALDYAPAMSPLAQRMGRRCWPGPVAFRIPTVEQGSLLSALPQETRTAVACAGHLQFRVPAHEIVQHIMMLTPAPLVTRPENSSSSNHWVTGAEVAEALGDRVSLIIEAGNSRYAGPASVVRVSENSWQLEEAGVVGESTLGRMACETFLFVCTGNTCRSPLAEGAFRKLMADRLKCSEEELSQRGYIAASAGISAIVGAPAAVESVDVARKYAVDLTGHSSQPLTDRLIEQADHVFTMTRSHWESVVSTWPDAAARVRVLAPSGEDIADPIGGGPDEYAAAWEQIEKSVRSIVNSIEIK